MAVSRRFELITMHTSDLITHPSHINSSSPLLATPHSSPITPDSNLHQEKEERKQARHNGTERTTTTIPRGLVLVLETSTPRGPAQVKKRHPTTHPALHGRRSPSPPHRLGAATRRQDTTSVLRKHHHFASQFDLAPSIRRRRLSVIIDGGRAGAG